MNSVLYWLGLLLYLYSFVLIARLIMSWVLALTAYRPSGAVAVLFEAVWAVTEPPLRALRRVIPDLRIGNSGLDMSFLVLTVIVFITSRVLMAG